MAKRGPVAVLTEKKKREHNRYWDWVWQDQYRWCRPSGFATQLREQLEKVNPERSRDKILRNIVVGLLRIPEEGLDAYVQGQNYDTWNTIFKYLEYGSEEIRFIAENGDTTGERNEYDQFVIDWYSIREGSSMFLLGTRGMKIRWEAVYRTAAYLLGIIQEKEE